MKILLVNAHGIGKNANKRFELFESTVSETVANLVKMGYHCPTITTVDLNGIKQYLYDCSSRVSKEETKKVIYKDECNLGF